MGKESEANRAYHDKIAGSYDAIYSSDLCIAEDCALFSQVNKILDDKLDRGYERVMFLDAGCGTGLALDHVQVVPGEYLGFDISERMIEEAKTKYKSWGDSFEVQDMTEMRVDWVQKFDIVFCGYGSISFLTIAEIRKSLQLLYSYLRPSGKMVLVPNGTRKPDDREFSAHYRDSGVYMSLLSLGEWRAMLRESGFRRFRIAPFNTEADEEFSHGASLSELQNSLHSDLNTTITNSDREIECGYFWIEINA